MLKNKFEHLIASSMEANLNSEEYKEIFQQASLTKKAAFEQIAAKKEEKKEAKPDKKVAAKAKKICKLLSNASELLEDCGCDSGCNCKQMSAMCLKMVTKLTKAMNK